MKETNLSYVFFFFIFATFLFSIYALFFYDDTAVANNYNYSTHMVYLSSENISNNTAIEYFYDTYTKVLYMKDNKKGGITPIFNSDGTLMLYNVPSGDVPEAYPNEPAHNPQISD